MDYFVIPGDSIIEFPKVTWFGQASTGFKSTFHSVTVFVVEYSDMKNKECRKVLSQSMADKFISSYCQWRNQNNEFYFDEVKKISFRYSDVNAVVSMIGYVLIYLKDIDNPISLKDESGRFIQEWKNRIKN